MTFNPQMLGSQPRALRWGVSSSFFNKQKIAPWRWGPGIDECGPNPQLWLRHPHNNSNPKHSNF